MNDMAYRSRESVEAIQFTGENASDVYRFLGYDGVRRLIPGDTVRHANEAGVMKYLTVVPDIHVGDWLVRRTSSLHRYREFSTPNRLLVYDDAGFRATYAPERDDTAEPDHAYDKDNWERTIEWRDRSILTEHLDFSHGVMEIGTLYEGPPKYAALVPVTFDDLGDPDETEVRWFDSREEADAALAKWKAQK